jgi:hypothetical protein
MTFYSLHRMQFTLQLSWGAWGRRLCPASLL